MPNWVYGHYAIKGPKENVLAFLNEGIRNSGYEPMQDCRAAYGFLCENAKTKASDFGYVGHRRVGTQPGDPAAIVLKDGLTMCTFRPMPDTFLLYDTTNCAEQLPEVALEQKKLYGVVGWYDWGCKFLGTKWNAHLTDTSFSEDGDTVTLRFRLETAWSYPDAWLRWVKDTFHVGVLLYVDEESGAYCFYGEVDGDEQVSLDESGRPDLDDFEDEDAYWDAVSEWECEHKDTMLADFNYFVENW